MLLTDTANRKARPPKNRSAMFDKGKAAIAGQPTGQRVEGMSGKS